MAQDNNETYYFLIFYHRAIGESYKNKCVCIFFFSLRKLTWFTPVYPRQENGPLGDKNKEWEELARHLNDKAGVTLPQTG